MFKRQVKCVIWDLDDTIWSGTLAEEDAIEARPEMIALIRTLDSKGIVNSICSKNDFSTARVRLESMGVWDYFVFPVIAFAPKGQSVKGIVDNLQLRLPNVVFVDDNVSNREEALYYCPEIMVGDPNDAGFLAGMQDVVERTEGKSRLERYKILEQKHHDEQDYSGNTEFLEASEIKVLIVRNPGDLMFQERIMELANRTNQLNFTMSRFSEEDITEYFYGDVSTYIHHGAVFVHDNYGDYGLVGFYAVNERNQTIEHFFFSCRIMNMGIEQCVYSYLRSKWHARPLKPIEEQSPMDTSFINLLHKPDARFQDYIENKMDMPETYTAAIIAGCTSGVIAHYLPSHMGTPRFDNFTLAEGAEPILGVETLIYTIYSDYPDLNWKESGGFSYSRFGRVGRQFLEQNAHLAIYLILASEKPWWKPSAVQKSWPRLRNVARRLLRWRKGRGMGRVTRCNRIVRKLAVGRPNVVLVEVGDFVLSAQDQMDPRHFERIVIKRLCEEVFSSP
jgi:FkbH-like protein